MSTQKEFDARLEGPIVLSTMGSRAFAGIVTRDENNETTHGDHSYVQYFIPENASNYPIIFWHGLTQCGMGWETTTDGREGFWQIFQRLNYPVYIIDQCRRARASKTQRHTENPVYYPNLTHESGNWSSFRLGRWNPPEAAAIYEGSQFPDSPYALDQFFRMQVWQEPDPIETEFAIYLGDQMEELLKQAGPSMLFTHSHSGKYGFITAAYHPEKVKAVFTYEPGQCCFPDDMKMEYIDSPLGDYINEIMAQYMIPREKWMNLTKMPIRIFFGDFLPKGPSDDYGNEIWRIAVYRAKQMCELLNENGGDAKVIILPEVGIYGNTHYAMGELNNREFARLIDDEMQSLGLNASDHPHRGPVFPVLKDYTLPMREKVKYQ